MLRDHSKPTYSVHVRHGWQIPGICLILPICSNAQKVLNAKAYDVLKLQSIHMVSTKAGVSWCEVNGCVKGKFPGHVCLPVADILCCKYMKVFTYEYAEGGTCVAVSLYPASPGLELCCFCILKVLPPPIKNLRETLTPLSLNLGVDRYFASNHEEIMEYWASRRFPESPAYSIFDPASVRRRKWARRPSSCLDTVTRSSHTPCYPYTPFDARTTPLGCYVYTV